MRIVRGKVDDDPRDTSGGAIIRIISSSFSQSNLMVPPIEGGGFGACISVFELLEEFARGTTTTRKASAPF